MARGVHPTDLEPLVLHYFLPELKDQPVFLFAGGVILSFIITSFTGVTLERIFHQKWKDYSRRRFNFGGYVNLPYTVVWGAAALLCIWIVNPFLSKIIGILPYGLGKCHFDYCLCSNCY